MTGFANRAPIGARMGGGVAAVTPLLGALLLGAAPLAAQEAEGLQEIIVTAQKREESLQATPISIVALGSAELERSAIHDITDLRAEVPSLQITPHPNSGATARMFMRGVGNNDDQITQDPSVAVYVDGIYVARTQGLVSEVAELERIEVLRGPQGSLYGRNATGGAINFITRAPSLDRFSAKQTFSAGNYGHFRSRTRVNVPLADSLAVELGFMHTQRDGFVKNRGTGVKRFGDQNREAWRGALLWQPLDSVSLRYSYDRTQLDDTPVFMAVAPFYPLKASRPSESSSFVSNLRRNDITSEGHNITATWDVADGLTLKSLTGFRSLNSRTFQNYHAGVTGPFALIDSANRLDQDQVSEELQLVGDSFDSTLQYILGLYYFQEDGTGRDVSLTPASGTTTTRTVGIDNSAYAAFGQATWSLAQLDRRLHLTAGLRWSRDERKASLQDTTVRTTGTTVGATNRGSNGFDNVSPTFVVGYDVTPDVNAYGKWVRGYKSGGFNVRASSVQRFAQGFKPETLTSYELGLKSSWLDNRLRVNVAGFVSDYRDIQINLRSDPVNVGITDVLNGGKAKVKGLEADITARPIPALTASVNYAWLLGDYKKVVDATGADRADFFEFIETPRHAVSAKLEYTFPETAIGTFSALADYSYQARKTSSTSDPRYKTAPYALFDARVTLSDIPVGVGEWRLSLFGKNLTDKEYYIAHFNAGVPTALFGQPRTWGLELIVEY